ncbi:hypothetical protein M3P05_14535 [Sansalvadorimonas sp. 2012CJ34-2]|uniref:Type II secretion system protein GspC N-terminal domain-containing protein n=1 Tax=Parendozoicomonas callyspongiae TaxID=2942213 RepID=A0ABT0PIG5_9GAMM|nr:type II secretion system protein N [Sansalvadorimonas sp. 2012CJ34-2]MCL6271140.1 hypothetical protein [Sansalvadorimonas sp. 2012CJ34-2]
MNNETLVTGKQWLVKHHRQVIFILLCLGLLVSLAMHLVRIIDDLMTEPPEHVTQSSEPPKKMIALRDYKFLFGEADDKPTLNRTANIPKSNLNLTLRGALAGDGEVPSSAIIQGGDGQDHLYLVGDYIPGGAQLDSVHPHHVVISYNGKLQKLVFPEVSSNQGVELYSPPPPSAASTTKLPPGPVNEASQNAASQLDWRMDDLRQRLDE